MPSQSHRPRQSSRAPLVMPVLCRHDDGTVKALAQDISREGLFMHVREYLHPCSIQAIELVLPDDPVPLRLAVSVRFIGRIPAGFGIGARIIEQALPERQRWERLYHSAVQGGALATRESLGERVVATAGALPPIVQAHLEAHGFTLVQAPSNCAVLQLLRPGTAEVVLCNMHDPQLGGPELCARIRRQPAFARIACILVTESKLAGDFLAGLNAGAAYVISKPFSAEYCASRVIAAARQADTESDHSPDTAQQPRESSGASFGATAEYLHAPAVLPPALVRAIDRVSDAVFFTRLAARHQLRKCRDFFSR